MVECHVGTSCSAEYLPHRGIIQVMENDGILQRKQSEGKMRWFPLRSPDAYFNGGHQKKIKITFLNQRMEYVSE